jgi:HSP20 family protein
MTKAPTARDVAVSTSEAKPGFNPMRSMLELFRRDRAPSLRQMWPFSGSAFRPTFDVKERLDVYVVRADLPGVKVQDVEVLLSQKKITITGKREDEPATGDVPATRLESRRPYGKFSRSITLPPEVDVSQCQADLRDGVLTLELPKNTEAVMRKISVKSERARP